MKLPRFEIFLNVGKFRKRNRTEQFVIPDHKTIVDRHHLAKDLSCRIINADVVPQAFAHLVHAIEALKERHHDNGLGSLTVFFLELSPHEQVKLLVGAAELHIRLQHDRVIPLDQRVKELMNADRQLRLIALFEVLPFKHPGHGMLGSELDQVAGGHFRHPLAIKGDPGLLGIKDPVDLGLVGLRVRRNFLLREMFSRFRLTRGVADHPGKVTDQEDDLMTELLELSHLVQEHRMPQMDIRRSRVKPGLHPERFSGRNRTLKLFQEIIFNNDLHRTAFNDIELLFR